MTVLSPLAIRQNIRQTAPAPTSADPPPHSPSDPPAPESAPPSGPPASLAPALSSSLSSDTSTISAPVTPAKRQAATLASFVAGTNPRRRKRSAPATTSSLEDGEVRSPSPTPSSAVSHRAGVLTHVDAFVADYEALTRRLADRDRTIQAQAGQLDQASDDLLAEKSEHCANFKRMTLMDGEAMAMRARIGQLEQELAVSRTAREEAETKMGRAEAAMKTKAGVDGRKIAQLEGELTSAANALKPHARAVSDFVAKWDHDTPGGRAGQTNQQ